MDKTRVCPRRGLAIRCATSLVRICASRGAGPPRALASGKPAALRATSAKVMKAVGTAKAAKKSQVKR